MDNPFPRVTASASPNPQATVMGTSSRQQQKGVRPLHGYAARQGPSGNVIVEVGPEGTKFYVQAAFLTYYSDYFYKALNGPWKEAEDRVVRLVDVEPDVFSTFIDWLYTREIPDEDDVRDPNNYDLCIDMWQVKLYVFADRFSVLSLRTQMNREIVRRFDGDDYASIAYAFDNLPHTDPLLDFFADSHYERRMNICYEDEEPDMLGILPKGFFIRFYKRTGYERARGRGSRNFHMDSCSYHGHESGIDKDLCEHKAGPPKKNLIMKRLDGKQDQADL